jgi:List-Bact-rpt repeat protein
MPRYSSILLPCLYFVALLPLAAQDTPFATDFPPKLSFTETYIESVVSTKAADGSQSLSVQPSNAISIAAAASLQNLDLSTIDPSTPVVVQVGTFNFSGVLADDPNFKAGASVANIPLYDIDANTGEQVAVGNVAVTWNANTLTVTVKVTELDLTPDSTYWIDAQNYAGTVGALQDTVAATLGFADESFQGRLVYNQGTGSITTQTSGSGANQQSWDLSHVALSGAMDSTRPTVTIDSPAANDSVFDSGVTIFGSASDTGGSAGVAQVLVQLNGGDFVVADGTDQWSIDEDVNLGTNTVSVKSVDADGNESLVLTRTFTYVLNSPLTVSINKVVNASGTGNGTVTSGFLGTTMRPTGSTITITATPATGSLFDGWTGSIVSTSSTLTFTQWPNTVLQASFIANPYSKSAGTYSGLVAGSSPSSQGAGFATTTVTSTGAFTSTITLAGVKYSLKGTLSSRGDFTGTIPRKGLSTLTVNLHLDLVNGTQQLTGTIGDGTFTSNIVSDSAVFSAAHPAPQAGTYTLLIPPDPNSTGAASAQGVGYGTMSIDATGLARIAATLGDGTIISASATVSKAGVLPIYLPLYTGMKGALYGNVTFRDVPASDCDGTLQWIKPSGEKIYPLGFTTQPVLIGSRYKFTAGTRVLAYDNRTGNAVLTWQDGNLNGTLTQAATLSAASVLSATTPMTTPFTFKLTTTTGLFSGTFTPPGRAAISFNGVLFQKQKIGAGMFLNAGQTGSVTLQAAPPPSS